MSGIEIAGLVLGAFPILLSACEKYKENCEPFLDWWRFEQVLGNLIRPVICEEVFFKQNLEELLLPIVDSDEDLQEMCADPKSDLWQDPVLDKLLHERLGTNYSIYFDMVTDMSKQLEKIGKVLGVEPGRTEWLTDPHWDWKHEYKRLKICFKKTKAQKYATTLAEDNTRISRLLKKEQNLGHLRQNKRSPVGNFLQKVREAALNLHSALSKGWMCQCSAPHSAILRLEQRPAPSKKRSAVRDEDFQFSLLFCHTDNSQSVANASWTETLIVTRSSSSGSTPTIPKPTALAEIQYNLKSLQVSSTTTKATKKIAWATTNPLVQPIFPISTNHITDLCGALRCTYQEGCVGYISESPSEKHFLTQWKKNALDDHHLQALDKSLVPHGQNLTSSLSIPHRIQLAVAVASNVLQLWGTPWLRPDVSKEDLRIWPSSQRNTQSFVQAVFDKQPLGAAPAVAANTVNQTRETMLRLAIVLLELCFGERLESQPFRRNYLGPGGCPSDLTDKMTAIKWQESVQGTLGEKYATLVSCCIDCRFGVSEPNLEDAAFRQSVHANVVEPLQEIASVLA